MSKVTMRVDIGAPVDEVFGFVADYRNALLYMEHFQTFRALTKHTSGLGATVRASGRLHGLPISTDLQIVSYEPNRRLVSTSRRGIRSYSEWRFEAVESSTRVTFTAEYALPNLPLGSIFARLVDHDVKSSTRRTLENLKREMERRRRTGG